MSLIPLAEAEEEDEGWVWCAFCGDRLPREEAVRIDTVWGDGFVCPECYEWELADGELS